MIEDKENKTLNLQLEGLPEQLVSEEVTAEEKVKLLQFLAKTDKMLTIRNHPLQEVFNLCLDQLTKGKGNDRHGKGKEFMDQPWKHLADAHGVGFLTGQSAKKLEEAQGFEECDRWEREMIGVIVYAAMAILYRKMEDES